MSDKIRIGIVGYGNLGRGVEAAVRQNEDMTLKAIVTRRDPGKLRADTAGVQVVAFDGVSTLKDEVDVMLVCGGSATDLPVVSPKIAGDFHMIDSFDTHANIPAHFKAVDEAARAGGKLALISAGWDPGLFSLMRLYASAILPEGKDYTFWGPGVSQGHSDAIRRIEGVLDARQYTMPVQSVIQRIRGGETPELSARQKHTRECYVTVAEGADRERIEREIVTMPNYFADYDTTVQFISMEEMKKNHSAMGHGGFVIRNGKTGFSGENTQTMEFALRLDSNPEFTASVLLAYARALFRMGKKGESGCITVFDVPPALLSPMTPEQLRAKFL